MRNQEELKEIGNDAAMKVMVALALAMANRQHEDPRGALRDVLMAAEQQVAESIRKLSDAAGPDRTEVIADAASSAILNVGQMADSLLTSMGAPPATET